MRNDEWSDSVLWYFNYYLGYGFKVYWSDGTTSEDYLTTVLDGANGFFGAKTDVYPFLDDVKDFKLILKHVTDMPKSTLRKYRSLCKKIKDSDGKKVTIVDTPASLHFLIKNGYDAFELIEKGFANNQKNY